MDIYFFKVVYCKPCLLESAGDKEDAKNKSYLY